MGSRVKCAETLRDELLLDHAEVVHFSRRSHLVFSPLPAGVADLTLRPLDWKRRSVSG